MNIWIDLLALAGYAGAVLLVSRAGDDAVRRRQALMLAAAGMLLHAAGLGIVQGDQFRLGFGSALSLFLWQCALVHAVLTLRYPLWQLAVPSWTLAGAGLLLSRLLPAGTGAATTLDLALRLHILLSLTAWALLTLAAMQLAAYALLDRRLRHHGTALPGGVPLQTMERLAFGLITAGFATLCLSVASGFLFVDNFLAQHLVHKAVLSVIACAVFAALLLGRSLRGWRGATAVRWAGAGYASLVLAYFGSKLVLELILGRSWT